jgi:hypothetical protein
LKCGRRDPQSSASAAPPFIAGAIDGEMIGRRPTAMTRSRWILIWILDTPVVPNRSTSKHFSFKKNMVAARLQLFDDQPAA